MRRLIISLMIACSSVAVAQATPTERPPAKIAPADEYFGRLKMSILGIGNIIKDQSKKFDLRPDLLEAEMGAVALAVDAIKDWQKKYPQDPWIAKTLFYVERFYNRIPTDEGRTQARATMLWLVRDFPNTWYGRTGKRELAEGKVGAPVIAVAAPAAVVSEPVPVNTP
jgi:hypothetical protein